MICGWRSGLERISQSAAATASAILRTPTRSPLKFFVLVFVLTVPFVGIGAVTGLQLLPGVPVAALAFVCPGLAAVILVYRERRIAGVKILLMRSFDYRRIKPRLWYLPIVLLLPTIAVVAFGVLRLMGALVPPPQISIVPTLGLMLACVVAALGEELGWSGYALDPLQDWYGALSASLILGLVWAAWHLVPLLQAHRALDWIAWWCLGTLALRVVMVWLYNNTGKSVFAMVVFHAMSNVAWQLFPVHGSFFDPRVNGLIAAFIVFCLIAISNPRTFARR
jgi:membrane protease YdiL (CAAX protease family)